MGRPRKYESDADRLRAFRERQRGEQKMSEGRQAAIDAGAALGADEARRRGERDEIAMDRVNRARAHAAWDFDGRPLGKGREYQDEFGLKDPDVTPSLARPEPRRG